MKRLFVAIFVAALSASPDARACSPPSCEEGELFPSGSVPANFPGVLWMAGMREGKRGSASDLRQLGAALFSDASLTVTPARPRPRRLGVLTKRAPVRGPLEVTTWSGSCSDTADAVYVDVELDLFAEAKPWADALVFVTLVDGQPWFPSTGLGFGHAYGESWVGRGRDRLYASCEPKEHDDKDRGLEPGLHEVRIKAHVRSMRRACLPSRRRRAPRRSCAPAASSGLTCLDRARRRRVCVVQQLCRRRARC
jgi:hypothetical protein